MADRPIVLGANILIRAVLGKRVRGILEAHADDISFFVPETACAEAEEHLARLVAKRGVIQRRLSQFSGPSPRWALSSLTRFIATSNARPGNGSVHAILKTGPFLPPLWRSYVRSGPKIRTFSAAASIPGLLPPSPSSLASNVSLPPALFAVGVAGCGRWSRSACTTRAP